MGNRSAVLAYLAFFLSFSLVFVLKKYVLLDWVYFHKVWQGFGVNRSLAFLLMPIPYLMGHTSA